MPRLVEVQKKYSPSEKFTVFISNVQRNDEKSCSYYKKDAPGIPVYYMVNLKHAPCGRGIPSLVLFDHTGKIVKQGHDETAMLAMIPDLIKAAPDPVPPILGDVEIRKCKMEARALAKGRPIALILKRLDKYAEKENDRGKEAKALAIAVREYLEKETARLVKLTETKPATATFHLQKLLKQSKGLPQESTIKETLAPLAKDKNIKALVKLIADIRKAKTKLKKNSSSKSATKSLCKTREKLRKFVRRKGLSALLKAEAKEMIE